ncbi:MAG: hypothetical protein P1U82_27240 [Verrucomicrobiales bacterium]|nr:hypothetical protein [Verrucomicrobiales bacterium]
MNNDLKTANASGFPLQLAVASAVESATARNGWRVSTYEHAWKSNGQSGFADLVLENKEKNITRMVVECKKRKGSLLFYCPSGKDEETARFGVRWGFRLPNKYDEGGWEDVKFDPPSLEAEFCIVNGDGNGRQRTMLEGLAHEVIQSVCGICDEELRLSEDDYGGSALVYMPVIVTTAALRVCKFKLDDVSLETGEISDAEFESVPFIRFRKTLTFDNADLTACSTLDDARRSNERTVLVVHAASCLDFLDAWGTEKRPDRDFPWLRVMDKAKAESRLRWQQEALKKKSPS